MTSIFKLLKVSRNEVIVMTLARLALSISSTVLATDCRATPEYLRPRNFSSLKIMSMYVGGMVSFLKNGLTLDKVDYVEEDMILSELPVETREVSDIELAVEDESADMDGANVPAGSAGGPNRQKSNIGGTLSWGQG